jgi:hypothetical protein
MVDLNKIMYENQNQTVEEFNWFTYLMNNYKQFILIILVVIIILIVDNISYYNTIVTSMLNKPPDLYIKKGKKYVRFNV